MRNRVKKWHKLLGLANMLLFLGFAILAATKHIAIINIIPVSSVEAQPILFHILAYAPYVLALAFVFIGFCCLRCVGTTCKKKYATPIIMGSLVLLVEMLCSASVDSRQGSFPPEDSYFLLTRSIFYFSPILQLLVYHFVNQLDHWNRLSAGVLSVFYLSHAALLLGIFQSESYILSALDQLPFLKDHTFYTHQILAYLFIVPSLMILLPLTRRLGIYLFGITCLLTILLAASGNIMKGEHLSALGFILAHSPLYSLPILIKLSLAQISINQSLLFK